MNYWRTNEVAALASLSGGCALQAAASLGRSPRAVQDKARSIGIAAPRMPHAAYWPDRLKTRVMALRDAGRTVRSISETTGIPFGTVRRWVYQEKSNG